MKTQNRTMPGQGYKLIFYGNTLSVKRTYDICSYDENTVILKCKPHTLSIKGAGLVVSSMDTDEIYIRGKISDISFS